MNLMNPRHRVLAILCVMLAGLAALPWVAGGHADADQGSGMQTIATSLGPVTGPGYNDPAPIASYSQTVERPVFLASRRVAGAGATTENGKMLLLDRYMVVGLVVAGDRRIVLIRPRDGDKVIRVEQGDEVDGWTFADVSRERLVVEKAGTRKEFPLGAD